MPRNVANLVDAPRMERKEVKPPTFEQVRSLLTTVRGDPLEAAFTAGLALGLRRGEILGLRWEDTDFEGRTIAVKQALRRSGGRLVDGEGRRSKLHFVAPKSFRSVRTIAMPECVAAALRVHRARRLSNASQPEGLAGSRPVFATRKGTPVEPRRLDEQFKRLLTKGGLPSTIRLHDSRHFAATLLLAQGTHPRTVMEILGHSDIGLTMNTYRPCRAGSDAGGGEED